MEKIIEKNTAQSQIDLLPSMPEKEILIQVKKDVEDVNAQSKGSVRGLAPGAMLEAHPAAEEYPVLSYEEYRVLENSIREDGLQEPIKLSQGKIIDGRHRYRACIKLEIPIHAEELNLSEEEICGYVYSSNIRRSLSTGQWALKALKELPEYEDRAEARKLQNLAQNTEVVTLPQREESGRAIELLAEKYPVSASCIQFAKQIKEHKPELLGKVWRGTMTLSEAYKKCRPRPSKEKKPRDLPMLEIPLYVFEEFLTYIQQEKLQEYSTHVTGKAKIAITKYIRHIKPDSVQEVENE